MMDENAAFQPALLVVTARILWGRESERYAAGEW